MLLQQHIPWLEKLDISGVVSPLPLERIQAGGQQRLFQQQEAQVQVLPELMVWIAAVLLHGLSLTDI